MILCPLLTSRGRGSAQHAIRATVMPRKQRRLVLIGNGMAVLAIAVALMLNALRDSIVF
jgi:hypothetical protein